jgi:hypothetical protein
MKFNIEINTILPCEPQLDTFKTLLASKIELPLRLEFKLIIDTHLQRALEIDVLGENPHTRNYIAASKDVDAQAVPLQLS